MNILNHKGTALIFAIIAITLMAVLGTGIYFMTTTTTFSGLDANRQNRAYQMAVAGRDYALVKNLPNTPGSDFTFANGDKFNLVISGDTITSTGIINEGTPYEARHIITSNITGFGSRPDKSFDKDIDSFPELPTTAQPGFVSVDKTAKQISLGQFQTGKFGSIWYSGTSALGNCEDGKCDFGGGFRAFFVFELQKSLSYTLGDGFTFAIFNGDDNDKSSVGGHGGMGELMAYAGSSYVSPGLYLDNKGGQGIRPPKIAVEFDPYTNTGCPVSPCLSDSRCDSSDDHMAYIFWGDNTEKCFYGTMDGRKTYDDNQHETGSGGVNEPTNSLSDGTDTDSYFSGNAWGSSWFERTVAYGTVVYAFRIEVRRSDPSTGNYNYEIKSWIKECPNFACTSYVDGDFGNTKVVYTADTPTIMRTVAGGNQIVLNNTYHNKFNKFLFGWTAATGGATQNVVLKDFKMYFAREPLACSNYGVWNNLGATRYFKINGIGACISVPNNSFVGNIGSGGTINGYTDSICTSATSPTELTYNQANTADTNIDCAVYFDGTDK